MFDKRVLNLVKYKCSSKLGLFGQKVKNVYLHRNWYGLPIISVCAFVLLLSGCTNFQQSYIEGQSTIVGLYIPYDGGIYGVQVLNHLSGIKLSTSTNDCLQIKRTANETNSYFGIVETKSVVETKIQVN